MDRVFAQSEVGKLGFDEQGRLAWADQVVATTAEVLRNNLLATRPEPPFRRSRERFLPPGNVMGGMVSVSG